MGTARIVSWLLIGEDRAGLTYQPPGQTDEVTVVYVLVRVQGQLVTVKVVAWRKSVNVHIIQKQFEPHTSVTVYVWLPSTMVVANGQYVVY